VSGRAIAYLRVEKHRFLFLEGSAGADATDDAATVEPPDASAVRASTSAACAASSVDCPAAGASAPTPGACSSAASAALGEGGAGSHLSGGACPPSLSSSSSSSYDEYSDIAGGESPCCSRSRNSSSLCSWRRIPRSFFCAARSYFCRCTARARARARGVGERTAQRSWPPSVREDETSETWRHMAKE
jgi:hypothetical protein